MSCRFDESTKTFEIAVRELARDPAPMRIGFDRSGGWSNLAAGSQLHSRILKERCGNNSQYQSEVYLEAKIPVKDWIARVHGRLDGCLEGKDGCWRIEEFKSCDLVGAGKLPGFILERDRRQLLLYCYLWQQSRHQPVSGALIYVDPATEKEFSFSVPFNEEEARAEITKRLENRLGEWLADGDRREAKKRAASSLPFPYAAPRPGQIPLMEAIRQSVETGSHLMAEAPTGSGKTAAAIHPTLQYALAHGKQLVFLTSKTLQQKMAVDCLEQINQGAFRTLRLRAKEKMCANDQVICHEDFCPYARGFAEKIKQSKILQHLAEDHSHLEPETVFAAAKKEVVCPFAVQLELAEKADALICDYNYVLEPGTSLSHLAPENLGQVVLVIDEAHNVPDRARKIFSPELKESFLRGLLAFAGLEANPVFENVKKIVEQILAALHVLALELPEAGGLVEIPPPFEALRELWRNWLGVFSNYLSARSAENILEEDPVFELHSQLTRLISVSHLYSPGFSCVIERSEEGVRLALICLDPSRPLRPLFKASSSTILLSATLSPPDTLQRQLGLERDRTTFLKLPSPFPKENRKILLLPQVRTSFNVREKHFDRIAGLLASMASVRGGNHLALFPSYRFLEGVQSRLPRMNLRLLVQHPGSGEAEQTEIFSQLQNSNGKGALLLAVLGGMYAEGLDYPGGLLNGVFIVSPALPQVSPERELLRRYFDEVEEAGFEYAYLHPGMIRVIQAAGRLIRSESDRGVIALLCSRFLEEPYRSYLPRDWYEHSPSELISLNPAAEVAGFFDSETPLFSHQNGLGKF